jgi:hypothetical protein
MLRKIVLVVAGLLLAYVGLMVAQAFEGMGIAIGRWIGIGIIIYGLLIALSYLVSIIRGKRLPFIPIPFIPPQSDPGISKDERIQALQDLLTQGLLTQEQFEKKRDDILNSRW